jgi:hypothetical protein
MLHIRFSNNSIYQIEYHLSQLMVCWVSEWLLPNANSAIFQLYRGENKLIFNKMMMRSTLY